MNNLFDPMNNSIIKVIGVGGGGSNAVSYMYRQGIIGVDFAFCNTDKQALEISPIGTKVQLGPSLTEGMGAGSIPEVGKQSCIESIDEVRKFLEQDTKMLFVTAGMGGGTGTGAAPIIAKAARELEILTVGIVTMPFKFEGLRRRTQALEGLDELKKNVDALLVISNDRVKKLFPSLAFSEALAKADDILATAARGIAEIITVPGYINVDFKDVNTVMKNSGVAIMGFSQAEGEDRARIAVREALNSPLLEDNDIRGAQHILLNITSGTKEVTMEEITEITEYIEDEAGIGTDMIWGNCSDPQLGEKISVTIIATGFDGAKPIEVKPKRVHIDAEPQKSEVFDIINIDSEKANVIEFDNLELPKNNSEPFIKEITDSRPTDNFHIKKIERIPEPIEKPKRGIPRNPINSPKDLAELEDIPAFKRKRISLDNSDNESGSVMSKLSINLDENDKPIIERNNSFFHDNVD